MINQVNGKRGTNMKNLKQLKEAVLKIEKKNKARNMINRAFATLRTNYGFTYQD